MTQKYTEAKKEGNKRWDDKNLDRMSIALPKGKKDEIKEDQRENTGCIARFIQPEKSIQCQHSSDFCSYEDQPGESILLLRK